MKDNGESASIGFVIFDANFYYIYANQYGAAILNRSQEELKGQMAWTVFPAAIRHACYNYFHQALKDNKEITFKEFVKPSNQWVHVSVYPVDGNLHIIFQSTYHMENQPLNENEVFENYTNHVQDLITLTSEDGIILYVSPSIQQLLGFGAEDMYGANVFSFCHPEDLEALMRIFDHNQMELDQGTITCRFLHKHGWYVWFENNFKWLFHADGSRSQKLGIWRDISARKQEEERFIQAQRLGQFGSFERELHSNMMTWSEEMFRIHGIQPTSSRIDLNEVYAYILPDDREKVALSVKEAVLLGESDVTYRILRQSNEIRHLHSQIERIFLDGGQVAIRGLAHDITEFKQIEDELLQSKARLEIAQEIAGLGHYEWDVINNLVTISDELLLIFGYEVPLQNMPIDALLYCLHPDDDTLMRNALKKALQEGTLDLVYRIIIGDEVRILHTLARTSYDEWGRALRLFGTVQDITLQKQTEELLRKTEKLNVAGQLAAGIAHEIRNPLTALKGFAKLMCTANEENKQRYYHIMQEEFNRIELILGELLILAKPQVVDYRPHDPLAILDEVIQLLSTEAILNNVIIELKAITELPYVNCERNQLKQVFVNVIKNAIEAMPKGGGITIHVQKQGNSVVMDFIDQGQGIAEDRLPRIGEPFYTTKEKGTGLGLMVSFAIIEEHHGHISYQSKVGVGTTVHIKLPAVLP
ncbi:PAS domain S-box protein [Paenibacillus roseipurpureus]|uniref:histidine kinase n=1 Tax=Paenibacillus roseopurpureus TaxID=2918901 RepID=A0AA96LSM5_9BACL|nr:PAS domain S-box protein [Paenibacillus sp. MBLB1832]WNR46553.1 PAS domain-containing protein [Paenibacillus sp. MBLB1832]